MGARSDKLRRRPEQVRYFYLAVSENDIHTGASYGGLAYVLKNHGVHMLFLADLVAGQVRQVTEPVEEFMARWREHYDEVDWDYFAEVDRLTAAAKRRR